MGFKIRLTNVRLSLILAENIKKILISDLKRDKLRVIFGA